MNEMVSRCMVQVGKRGHMGRVKTCRMHDLMWDLCISKAKEESFVYTVDLGVENEGTILENVSIRRLCISSGESGYKLGRSMLSSLVEISPQLRSFLFRDFSEELIPFGFFDEESILFSDFDDDEAKVSKDFKGITRGCPCLHRLVVREYETEVVLNMAACSSNWPSNLTKLVLCDTRFDGRHMGPLAKLQSLKVLFLEYEAFIGKEMIFHENDFPKLHHLKLDTLRELEAWRVHEGALPSLVCLEIYRCRILQSVADGSQFLKQLKELIVTYMPDSFKRRVEQDWVRVSHDVPSMSFANIFGPGHPEEEKLDKGDDEIEVEVEQ